MKRRKDFPRACPLWITDDPKRIEQLQLAKGQCSIPALITQIELEGPIKGASAKLGKFIMVSCCEWYRRNKHLFTEGSGWILEAGTTDDYLDCPTFSEWYWKYWKAKK